MTKTFTIAPQFYSDYPPPDMILESKTPLPVLMDNMEKALSNYPVKYRKRTMFVFAELMQNIQKHQTGNDGVVFMWKEDEEIILAGVNNIELNNTKAIEKELQTAEGLSDDELKKEIKSRWQHPNKPGTGLLQMISKSNHFPDIKYKLTETKVYVSIKLHIHVN